MSEFHVEVVRVANVMKHPNADSLSCATVNGYPVIFRTGDYEEGSLAVHVPIDAIVPDTEQWSFLSGNRRIKAKKLRGIFSMGLLTPALETWVEGQNVQAELGIEKYDPDLAKEKSPYGKTKFGGPHKYDDNEVDPGYCPKYDIEGLRRYREIFQEGEEVWVSEKIHGQNARYVHDGVRLWCASRNFFKKDTVGCTWWEVARRYELEAKLATVPGIAIYGETYGNNADMPYGVVRPELDRFVMFDAFDTKTRTWFDVDQMLELAQRLDIPVVPTLYRGPWDMKLVELCEGKTVLGDGAHVREGIVVKPRKERWDCRIGRVFLKLAGEGYLLRKTA